MSHPRMVDGSHLWMRCAGAASDRHDGSSGQSFEKWVPFPDAIHNPPLCHGVPRETLGATRMRRLAERFSEAGIEGECRISYGFEQSTWCHPHGWAGAASEARGGRCPHYLLAAWVIRRHESAA